MKHKPEATKASQMLKLWKKHLLQCFQTNLEQREKKGSPAEALRPTASLLPPPCTSALHLAVQRTYHRLGDNGDKRQDWPKATGQGKVLCQCLDSLPILSAKAVPEGEGRGCASPTNSTARPPSSQRQCLNRLPQPERNVRAPGSWLTPRFSKGLADSRALVALSFGEVQDVTRALEETLNWIICWQHFQGLCESSSGNDLPEAATT